MTDPGVRTGTVAEDLAVRADAGRLTEIFVAAWRGGYRGVVPDDVIDALDADDLRAEFAGHLAVPHTETLVAREPDGGISGFARIITPAATANGSTDFTGALAALYVDPGFAGGGRGRALVQRSLARLSRYGAHQVTLWVFRDNARARALYESLGFVEDGRTKIDTTWRAVTVGYSCRLANHATPLVAWQQPAQCELTAVSVERISRPLRAPFRTALREVTELSAWLVTVTDAAGRSGRGSTVATPEVTGDTDERIAADLAGPLTAAVRGEKDITTALDRIAKASACGSARAGMDLALHDLAASSAGRCLRDLLGGHLEPVASDLTVSLDDPDTMAAATSALLSAGASTVKVKLGDAERDLDRLQAVHTAVRRHAEVTGSPTAVRADANQAWTPDEAIRLLEAAVEAGVALQLVEQPVAAADLDGMARVRAATSVPVLADESVASAADVRRVAAAGAADMVTLKLLKCGGLWPAREFVEACHSTGLGLVVGCMLEPAEGVAAASALAAAATNGPLAHDLDAAWWATQP